MRILVHGDSLTPGSRMALAAHGLALRGHAVMWAGGGCPAAPAAGPRALPGTLERLGGRWSVARGHAQVVLGGARDPLGAAFAGWLCRAHCLVLALDVARLRRWDWRARWAWGSLHATGLVEAGDAGALQRDPPRVAPERLGLWSDTAPPAEPRAEHLDTEILERACERSLARHRSHGERPAAFLDRDGTLVVERGYNSDPAGIELLPGAGGAVQLLQAAGLAVVVVSNQSGVGRGLFTLSRVHEAMAALRHALRARGAELDAIYFCPHRPEESCACRKPGIGLLERAAEDLRLSLARSVFVGDKLLDVETGRNAGGRGVLLRTGYGREEERRLGVEPGLVVPDRVCDGLAEAAVWIAGLADLDRHA